MDECTVADDYRIIQTEIKGKDTQFVQITSLEVDSLEI